MHVRADSIRLAAFMQFLDFLFELERKMHMSAPNVVKSEAKGGEREQRLGKNNAQ